MAARLMAWAVDGNRSKILMDEDRPACLVLSRDDLDKLDNFAYLYHDKILSDELLPDVVVSLFDLVQVGLVSDRGDWFYHHGDKHYQACDYRHLVSTISISLTHAMSHAIQLLRWRGDHRFCSRCGTPTDVHPDEYASTCQRCHHRSYPRISPCVITAVTRTCPKTARPQILLALHHRHKDTAMHGLIAGFVEIGESLETAVVRETQEETGITVANIRYITSQPWPYPTNLMAGFVAEYQSGEVVADTSELVYAKFFDLDKLPKIPQQGTIAHMLIQQVLAEHGVA